MVTFSWFDFLRDTNANHIYNNQNYIYSHIANDDERRGA